MVTLRRTQAGPYTLDQCHPLPDILAAAENGTLAENGWVLGVDTAFAALPALTVGETARTHLFNGCPTSRYPAADGRYRVYDGAGAFLGLAVVEAGVLRVEKLFCERT